MQTAAATGGSRVGPLQTAPGAAHTCTLRPESSPAPPCKGARACSWPVPRCFSEAHPLGHWLLTYRPGTLRLGLPSLAASSGGKGDWEIGQRAFVPPEWGAGLSPVRWGADAQAEDGLPVPGVNRTSQSKADTASRIPDAPGQVGRAVPRAGACVRRLGPRRLGDSDLEPRVRVQPRRPADVRVQEQPRRVPESGRGSSACRGVRGAPRKASRALRDAPTCFAPSLPVTTVVQTSVYVHVMETWGPGPAEPNESGAE